MGAGASVLRGGRPRLQLQCTDLRMAWCNGLVVYEDGTVRSIDRNEESTATIDYNEAMDTDADSDDMEDSDYDYIRDSDPEAEAEAVAALNVYWIARDYDRN